MHAHLETIHMHECCSQWSDVAPSSALKKKHNSCACRQVKEATVAGIALAYFAPAGSAGSFAGALTKPLPNEALLKLVKPLLFWLPAWHISSSKFGGLSLRPAWCFSFDWCFHFGTMIGNSCAAYLCCARARDEESLYALL